MKDINNIKIAVQNKWRLFTPSVDFLNSLWIKFELNNRKLIQTCNKHWFCVLYLRNEDIPDYVKKWIADFWIVWQNTLVEKKSKLKEIKKLWFWKCRLVIAVPINSWIKTLKDLNWKKIATSNPNTLKDFLNKNWVNASIIKINWSVEITTELWIANAICDLVQTWNTLKENNLVELVEIMKSETVLVESPKNNQKKNRFIELL